MVEHIVLHSDPLLVAIGASVIIYCAVVTVLAFVLGAVRFLWLRLW